MKNHLLYFFKNMFSLMAGRVATAVCLAAVCMAPAVSQQAPPAFVPKSTFKPVAPGDLPGTIVLRPASVSGTQPELWEADATGTRNVRNITVPTLTPVLPDPAKATGAAVIVAPGGGFVEVSIDNEGYRVARWLADHGIAAFVLKYRVDSTPPDPNAAMKVMVAKITAGLSKGDAGLIVTPEALEDAEAAVRLVRARALEWGVDPHRVGFAGFSAGAITAQAIGLDENKDMRPDFIASIYGPMYARSVPADAPPMFIALALDDILFGIGRQFGIIDSWRNAQRPIEVHLYERGKHGFGMAASSKAAALWIDEFYAWMQDRGELRVSLSPTP